MELRERGLSVDAAARGIGVSRTAGRNWANGYKTYRSGLVVGFVPALDRLAHDRRLRFRRVTNATIHTPVIA
jgi:IS30 family transposase